MRIHRLAADVIAAIQSNRKPSSKAPAQSRGGNRKFTDEQVCEIRRDLRVMTQKEAALKWACTEKYMNHIHTGNARAKYLSADSFTAERLRIMRSK